MEERKSPGAKGCYDQVQNAKWEIPDFSSRIGDNNIKDGFFLVNHNLKLFIAS